MDERRLEGRWDFHRIVIIVAAYLPNKNVTSTPDRVRTNQPTPHRCTHHHRKAFQ